MSALVELVKSVIGYVIGYVNDQNRREDLRRFAEIEYKYDSDFVYHRLVSSQNLIVNADEFLK